MVICLNLINTWDGNKQERWDHSISNIFQVLLSLQALMLNEEPYINEQNDESSSSSSLTDVIEVSSKFKEDMDLIYPKFVEAFTGIGASMEDMNELKKVSPNKLKVTEKTSGRTSVKKIKKS
ncbi:hypothetical protein ACSBR2_015276 [Camellia fascicularis]